MGLQKTKFLASYSETLRACRSFHNYSITDLAEYSGIHRNSISAIENRSHDASSFTCARLCFALNVRHIKLAKDSTIQLRPEPMDHDRRFPARVPYHAHIMERLGKAICRRRESLGLLQEELATLAGIHKNSLWPIERGLTIPTNYNLFSIYFSLEVTQLKADNFEILLQ